MDRKIIHLFTGADGKSHFENLDLHLECKVSNNQNSESLEATGITVWDKPISLDHDWHNAPHKQIMIMLEGDCEMEISDGTKHRFSPGDILLVEDTIGVGHYTRALSPRPRKAIVVTLD
jgi:quercetin dioxygenase-like cupin family protein